MLAELVGRDLGGEAFLWVTALGAVSGVLSLWAFRRWTKAGEVRRSANLIVAHLFEIQLFADEPLLVLRAQRQLLIANGHLLLALLRPLLIVMVPFAVLIGLAEPFFGNSAVRPGETVLLTVQLKPNTREAELVVPSPLNDAIKVDAPPVHVPADRQIVWRLRAVGAAAGNLQILTAGESVTKRITSAGGITWAPVWRSRFTLPGEAPLVSRSIEWINIDYPPAVIFHLQWLALFSLASFAGAGLAAVAL